MQHGWTVQGVETSATQVAFARTRYGLKIFEGELSQARFMDQSFDVITAWHVLEHIQNPRELISGVRRVLRPSGLLVVEVPNFVSWQSRLGRAAWHHLDVPRHILHFTPKVLEQLLHEHGLRVLELHFFSIEQGPFGMLQTMLNRVGFPPNWLYRWLRRSEPHRLPMLGLHSVALTLLGLPAIGLELLSVLAQAGGVIRVLAVRE